MWKSESRRRTRTLLRAGAFIVGALAAVALSHAGERPDPCKSTCAHLDAACGPKGTKAQCQAAGKLCSMCRAARDRRTAP